MKIKKVLQYLQKIIFIRLWYISVGNFFFSGVMFWCPGWFRSLTIIHNFKNLKSKYAFEWHSVHIRLGFTLADGMLGLSIHFFYCIWKLASTSTKIRNSSKTSPPIEEIFGGSVLVTECPMGPTVKVTFQHTNVISMTIWGGIIFYTFGTWRWWIK